MFEEFFTCFSHRKQIKKGNFCSILSLKNARVASKLFASVSEVRASEKCELRPRESIEERCTRSENVAEQQNVKISSTPIVAPYPGDAII